MILRLCFLLLLCAQAPMARACDLALLLAVDVSGSVDASEYDIQMGGLAAGLRDGIVVGALVKAEAAVAGVPWPGA